MVSPRKSRKKSACFSKTITGTPASGEGHPAIIPAGPPPAITQRVCSFSAMGFQSNSTQIKMKANMPEKAQDRAAFTYNAAADFYDASPLGFCDYFGRRTVELASLPIGSQVLDVCCGAGASALPTAEAVGPTGNVIGVDLARQLLESA